MISRYVWTSNTKLVIAFSFMSIAFVSQILNLICETFKCLRIRIAPIFVCFMWSTRPIFLRFSQISVISNRTLIHSCFFTVEPSVCEPSSLTLSLSSSPLTDNLHLRNVLDHCVSRNFGHSPCSGINNTRYYNHTKRESWNFVWSFPVFWNTYCCFS